MSPGVVWMVPFEVQRMCRCASDIDEDGAMEPRRVVAVAGSKSQRIRSSKVRDFFVSRF